MLATPLATDTSWMTASRCLEHRPAVFFPFDGGGVDIISMMERRTLANSSRCREFFTTKWGKYEPQDGTVNLRTSRLRILLS